MAVYYVSPTGGAPNNGLSWATAYLTIAAAIAAHHAAGDVIEIDGGTLGATYNESVNAQWGTAFTIQASQEFGHNGVVYINGAGKAAATIKVDKQTLNRLTIYGADSGQYNISANNSFTANDCLIGEINSDRSTQTDKRHIITSGASSSILNRCVIAGAGSTRTMSLGSLTAITANNCLFIDNRGRIGASGNATFNNCVFSGNVTVTNEQLIDIETASATVTLNNCISSGNGYYSTSKNLVQNTGLGTVVINNSLLLPQPTNPATYGYAGTQNNCVKKSPRFKTARRESYASIVVDDYESIDYFLEVAAESESRGVRAAIALSRPLSLDAAKWASMVNAVAAGHDVLNHTMTHPNLSISSALTIVGPADSTLDLSSVNTDNDYHNWTGTLACKVSGAAVLTVDIGAAGLYATPASIAARINSQLGGAGWTATVTASSGVASLATALTNVSGAVATGGGAVLAWDYPRYLFYEVGWAKKLIEQNLPGYICTMFAYPGGAFSAAIKGYINDQANYPAGTSKHIGARSLGAPNLTSYSFANDYTSGSGTLAGWQVFEMYSIHPANLTGNAPTDAQITEYWSAWAEWLKHIGGVGMTYMHSSGTDGATFYPATTIGKVIQALLDSGVAVATPSAITARVINSGLWSDVDGNGTRWSRAFTDSANYHLRPGSPCINAGVDVGLTTDADGRTIRGLPDIGAYEYVPKKNDGMGIGMGLGL